MSEIRIPVALDGEGRPHRAVDAPGGKPYFCPACGHPVLLQHDPVRTPHFAHLIDPSGLASVACRPETAIHKGASHQIRQAIADWKAGWGPQPLLQRQCAVCYRKSQEPVPDNLEEAIMEYRFPDGSVVDVALMARGRVQVAVEIRVSRPVREEKVHRLSVPFIELDGYEVVENPLLWRPIRERLRPHRCPLCRKIFDRFVELAKKLAERFRITLPDHTYRYGITRCYHCQELTLVFAWPNPFPPPDHSAVFRPVARWSSVPPPEPCPPNIRWVYSRRLDDHYWGNTCLACETLLGDWFLHLEPDGPFYRMLKAEDAMEDFELDLYRTAFQAACLGLLGEDAQALTEITQP